MHPKPVNAALMRLKNRKTNVMKEIEEWVLLDSEFNQTEAGRMSGKLTENITEERMLKSRLFDLGKERYKYLTKMAFDKHMFIEKQKKAKAKRAQILHHRSFSANDATFEKRTPDTRLQGRMSLDPRLLRNPDRDDDAEIQSLGSRAKTVQFMTSSTPVSNHRVSEQNKMRLLMMQCSFGKQKDVKKSRPLSRSDEDSVTGKSFVKKNRFSKFGGKFPTKTDDGRYVSLTSALSPNYELHADLDVKRIVQSIESLHKPAKNLKEVKPKLTQQLQAFMKERGITF